MKIRKIMRKMYETENIFLEYLLYYFLLIAYKIFKKYKGVRNEIRKSIKTFEGEEISKSKYNKLFRKFIIVRYVYCLRSKEYYLYGIDKLSSTKEIDNFMTRQFTKKYYAVINSEKYRKVFDKKNLLYIKFKDYFKRDVICVTGKSCEKEFKKFMRGKKAFILKPLSGHSGDGIKIYNKKDYVNLDQMFKRVIRKRPCVIEELIQQDDSIGIFHPESVNTVRVVTFQFNNCVSILWSLIRTGQGGSNVDNMGAAKGGGIGALIDPETGKIISDGFDWKGMNITHHPDSNIKFKNFQVPKWKELLELVTNLASEIPEMHCVGWDLALSKNGWVLVEGNARPQCVTAQTITKSGYKHYYDKMCTLVRSQKKLEEEIYEGKREV